MSNLTYKNRIMKRIMISIYNYFFAREVKKEVLNIVELFAVMYDMHTISDISDILRDLTLMCKHEGISTEKLRFEKINNELYEIIGISLIDNKTTDTGYYVDVVYLEVD
jgi:hypothetical protein